MKITINKKTDINVSEYDDDKSILEHYSVKIDTIPIFLHIAGKSGKDYKIVALSEKLVNVAPTDIDDLLVGIKKEFPSVEPKHVVFEWLKANRLQESSKIDLVVDDKTFAILALLDPYTFPDINKMQQAYDAFTASSKTQLTNLSKKLAKLDKLFNKLTDIEGLPTSEFNILSSTLALTISFPYAVNPLLVFDGMTPSQNIPFIMCFSQGKTFYKVSSLLTPPDKWIDMKPEIKKDVLQDGIYFKISINPPAIQSNIDTLDRKYSNGFWLINGDTSTAFISAQVSSIKHKIDQDSLEKVFLSSIENNLEYTLAKKETTGLQGTFRVSGVKFEPYIMADMITNDDLISSFLYVYERDVAVGSRKRSFYVHYLPGGVTFDEDYIDPGIGMHFTPTEGGVIVKITDVLDPVVASAILSKIFAYYESKKGKIQDIYTTLIGDVITGKKTKKKELDQKTGSRAKYLKKNVPDIWVSNYTRQCVQERQPYIVDPKDLDTVLEKLQDDHKVLEYNGVIYACEPREPTDKSDANLYPGLKENTIENIELRKKIPLLPCCFTVDQYDKGVTGKYIKSKMTTDETKEKDTGIVQDEKYKNFDLIRSLNEHIGRHTSLVDFGRLAKLPYVWDKICKLKGVATFKKSGQEFYSILRTGVHPSPDSFIHCLQRATDKSYASKLPSEQTLVVNAVKKKIASLGPEILASCAQELAGFSIKDIKNIFSNPEIYIDPKIWVTLVEKYFKCNIFLYQVSAKKKTSIMIPRNFQAWLSSGYDDTLPSVLVFVQELDIPNPKFPCQCEIAVQVHADPDTGKISKEKTLFLRDKIVDVALSLLESSNQVYVLNKDMEISPL